MLEPLAEADSVVCAPRVVGPLLVAVRLLTATSLTVTVTLSARLASPHCIGHDQTEGQRGRRRRGREGGLRLVGIGQCHRRSTRLLPGIAQRQVAVGIAAGAAVERHPRLTSTLWSLPALATGVSLVTTTMVAAEMLPALFVAVTIAV